MEGPDFTLFEQEIAAHLTDWRLKPELMEQGVNVGSIILGVFRDKCSIASTGEDERNSTFSLAIEITAKLLHPVWHKIDHSQMITVIGTSAEEALRAAAQRYANTTLTCLLSTRSEDHATGFEGLELDPIFDQYAPEGGIHLTVSPPHLSGDSFDNHTQYNHLTENPLYRFFPDSLAQIVSIPTYQIVCATIIKHPKGNYGGEVTVNGEYNEDATCELVEKFAAFSGDWPEFDASQSFVLQPRKVVDDEHWRLETRDPISNPTHDSFATCAVEQKLEPRHYFLNEEGNIPLLKTGGFLALLGGALLIPEWTIAAWIFMILGLGIIVLVFGSFFAGLKFAKEKFKYTLLTPGIITSLAPLKVLTLAPLAKTKFAPDRGDTFRFLDDPKLPGHNLTIGERIPIASHFTEARDDQIYWGDFVPEPVCWGVSDKTKLQESADKLGEHEFKRLENYWETGRIPPKFSGQLRAEKLPPPMPGNQ